MAWCRRMRALTGNLGAMSEAHPETTETEPVRTGVPEVDAVLESITGLDAADVAEHPAAFEAAHERLRRALDGHDA